MPDIIESSAGNNIPPAIDEVQYVMTLPDGAVIKRNKVGGDWRQVSPPKWSVAASPESFVK